MKILFSDQIKEVDSYTIKHEPIASIDLMERAASACSEWICKKFDTTNPVYVFSGPGNNGGDGLAIARQLAEKEYKVEVFLISKKLSDDSQTNYQRLIEQKKAAVTILTDETQLPVITPSNIIIDALFGSGLTRPLEGFALEVVKHINNSMTTIISIDIPSGLFGEDNSEIKKTETAETDISMPEQVSEELNAIEDKIIRATYTLTLELPFLSFFFPENEEYVGQWVVVPIGLNQDIIEDTKSEYCTIEKSHVNEKLLKRRKFSHKGSFGHALLISGSYGKMGAAVLASRACLKSGAGLLTTHIPKFGYEIMQTTIPEAMISIDKYNKVTSEVPYINNYTAIGVGPGIGKSNATQIALREMLDKARVPMVFDADAINIIGENRDYMNKIPPYSIFTPHPKEFERIAGKSTDDFEQNKRQIAFARRHNIYLVLKGAYTSIACPDGKCYFNLTGNPGMATAGSGDVLTGIILSLLAQGYSSKDAAIIGVYIHGLAGDLAAKKVGHEALIATEIINHIGDAFKTTKSIF